jgi:RNA polymerase sigma factor (sigma-70 family)
LDDGGARDEAWSRLMAAAQDGDRTAYETLLRECVPYIRAVVRNAHRTPDRAEEVVQEVLLTVHRVRHTYDPKRPFRPWLAAIARRRSVDALRRRTRVESRETFDPLAYETFADPGANRERYRPDSAAALRDAVEALPARQREALRLVKLRDMTLAEASAASGISIAALKVNVHRAIRTLRRKLSGEGDGT